MKKLFLAGMLMLSTLTVSVAPAQPKAQEFWVSIQNSTVTFHFISSLQPDDENYGYWLLSIVGAGQNVAYGTAKGDIEPPPHVTPDPDKGEILLELKLADSSHLISVDLIEKIKRELNKNGGHYKQVDRPKQGGRGSRTA